MLSRTARWRVPLVVVALEAVLAACGGDDGTGRDASPSADGSSIETDSELIEPGRFGSLTIGMDPGSAVETGLAIGPDFEAMCGDVYTTAQQQSDEGLYLEFDSEAPYDLQLAGVIPWGTDVAPTFGVHTEGGLEIGSSVSDVVEEYRDDAVFASFQAEGDPYGAYVVFDGEGGALQILVDSAQESLATVVTGFVATSGNSLDDVYPMFGGC